MIVKCDSCGSELGVKSEAEAKRLHAQINARSTSSDTASALMALLELSEPKAILLTLDERKQIANALTSSDYRRGVEDALKAIDVCSCGSGPEFRPVDQRYHLASCSKNIATMARALLTTEQGAGWQPIETAPRDGTKLLFYTPEDKETGWLEFIAESHYDKRGELNAIYVPQWQDGLEPTFWMPRPSLPAPPDAVVDEG